MNVNKHAIKLTAAAVAGTFAFYGAFSYWAGIKAEETLAEQHQMIAAMSVFKVKSHQYQRGWFSSQETTELEFNQELLGPYIGLLPENVRPLFQGTIRYHHDVAHGPLPGLLSGHFSPGRARVETTFDMSEGTRKTLQRFFGDAEPITVVNRLGLAGGGELSVSVPKFDYEETLAGVKMTWRGFDLRLNYADGYKEYQAESVSPGFVLEAGPKGRFSFDNIRYLSDVRPGNTGVKLGTGELSVANVSLKWNESIPYSIKLNELIHLVSRVRVGEFINPSGEFRPSNVELKNLKYQIVTSEQEEFINTRGKLDFDTFSYNDSVYGPLKLDISANHLHGPTLVKLDQAFTRIPFEEKDPTQLRKRYIEAITKQGLPLLINDPKIMINTFSLRMPTGEAKLDGQIALQGLQESDLKTPLEFIKRFIALLNIELPRQTLENMVVAQARNLFTVDASAEEQPDLGEIDNLAKSLLDAQLSEWESQKLITQQNGQLATKIDFKNGTLLVNSTRVALPWEEDAEEDAPPTASAAQ